MKNLNTVEMQNVNAGATVYYTRSCRRCGQKFRRPYTQVKIGKWVIYTSGYSRAMSLSYKDLNNHKIAKRHY